jgi:hypothetical protein
MELLVLALTVLIFGSMIGISMVSFTIAMKCLVKTNLLEEEILQLKNQSKKIKK